MMQETMSIVRFIVRTYYYDVRGNKSRRGDTDLTEFSSEEAAREYIEIINSQVKPAQPPFYNIPHQEFRWCEYIEWMTLEDFENENQ